MTAIRAHIYNVAPSDLDELLLRRGELIAAVRAGHPGLTNVRLVRLDDGTYSDTWHWESAEALGAALAALPTLAEAPRAMGLVQGNRAQNGTVVDER